MVAKKMSATSWSLGTRAVCVLLSVMLAFGLTPIVATPAAYAGSGLDVVTGGDWITDSGDYQIASDATGTISIVEGVEVHLVGWGPEVMLEGLSIEVGNGSTLILEDVYGRASKTAPFIDIQGECVLSVEGTNLIDGYGTKEVDAAVIHVGQGTSLELMGTGRLFGYKTGQVAYIGGNEEEANGDITFTSGTWFIKGTNAGAVIGGDSLKKDETRGDITINGGTLYVKGVAKGALIGSSNIGYSGNVYINGGLIELFQDFSGPAIGAGTAGNEGTLEITGGSLKTIRSANSWASYGEEGSYHKPVVETSAVTAQGVENYQVLALDVSEVTDDTVNVLVDGKAFYKGGRYEYVTNEVKNPEATEEGGYDTPTNWLENDEANLVTQEDYGTAAYPVRDGSSFVPENNLYLYLTRENHVVTVNGASYHYFYNEQTGDFQLDPVTEGPFYKIMSASSELKEGDTVSVDVVYGGSGASCGFGKLEYDHSVFQLVGEGPTQGSGLDLRLEEKVPGSFEGVGDEFSFYGNASDGTKSIVVATYKLVALKATDSASISLCLEGGKAAYVGSSGSLDEVFIEEGVDLDLAVVKSCTVGDLNDNGRINVADAQIVYDLATNVYGFNYENFPMLAKGWSIGTVRRAADVNADQAVDAIDARAIQYYVHYGRFGSTVAVD